MLLWTLDWENLLVDATLDMLAYAILVKYVAAEEEQIGLEIFKAQRALLYFLLDHLMVIKGGIEAHTYQAFRPIP